MDLCSTLSANKALIQEWLCYKDDFAVEVVFVFFPLPKAKSYFNWFYNLIALNIFFLIDR